MNQLILCSKCNIRIHIDDVRVHMPVNVDGFITQCTLYHDVCVNIVLDGIQVEINDDGIR